MTVQEIWNKIKDIFEPVLERAIKEVESWDGAASNYSDTNAYCAACLIDVNSAAGREDKAQSHCMLPVREAGDGADTYVRQGVHAAAGGNGITQVKRPDDVPEDDWTNAVQAAANKLISAYEQMEEVAPDAVYELAGKAPPEDEAGSEPEERAASMQAIYNQVMQLMGESGLYPMDVFHNGDELFAIGTKDGKLFKLQMTVSVDGAVELGEPQQVMVDFPPAETRNFSVMRQADGRYRWTAIACTAILNRDGELDTTQLFDNFIKHAETEGMPQLDFYHVPGSDMGEADYVARDGYTFISSGLFEDSDIGRAAAEGLIAQPGYWGTSIMYRPLSYELVDVGGFPIPAYTDGILRKITLLPESRAAALFTTMEVEMNGKIKDALRKLVGDALADEMEKRIDGVNQRVVSEAMIARAEAAAPDVPAVEPPAPPETAPALVSETDAIAVMRSEQSEIRGKLENILEGIKALVEEFEPRLAALERADEDRKRAWLSDLPARKTMPVAPVWRPREQAGQAEPESAAAQAERIMQSKKGVM